jgi:BAAT / Acyl-CoA thioester hydrolase C terminal
LQQIPSWGAEISVRHLLHHTSGLPGYVQLFTSSVEVREVTREINGVTFPEINAVAAWVPSGVVFWALGLAEPGDTRPPVAWTFRGEPLPYLQENNTSGDPPPVPEPGRPVAYAPFYRSQLRDVRAVERATIPVEKIRGPVQLVSGVDDQMWPSSELADIPLRRLETHRHPFSFRHLKFPEAGHTILVPYWPLPELRVLTLARVEGAQDDLLFQGGTAKADAEAGIDAWRDLLAFLDDARPRAASYGARAHR